MAMSPIGLGALLLMWLAVSRSAVSKSKDSVLFDSESIARTAMAFVEGTRIASQRTC